MDKNTINGLIIFIVMTMNDTEIEQFIKDIGEFQKNKEEYDKFFKGKEEMKRFSERFFKRPTF